MITIDLQGRRALVTSDTGAETPARYPVRPEGR